MNVGYLIYILSLGCGKKTSMFYVPNNQSIDKMICRLIDNESNRHGDHYLFLQLPPLITAL